MSRPFVRFLFALCLAAWFPPAASAAQNEGRRSAIAAMYPVMIRAVEAGHYGQARNICDQAILWEPDNPVHHYNLACIEARAGGARLPAALPALQRAAELGFADLATLRHDPDLDPIRADPRFAAIAEQVARHAAARAAAGTVPPLPDAAAPSAPRGLENLALLAAVDSPASADFAAGAPVGLYVMTRHWPATGRLERCVWYFAPDGTAYQNPEFGFAPAELAAHRGPHGRCAPTAGGLDLAWHDGKRSGGRLARDGNVFFWDRGNFLPARPFDPSLPVAGTYEGVETFAAGGNRAALGRLLVLRPDGTFYWHGVSLVGQATAPGGISAGANGTDSTGRWHAAGFSLVLVDAQGHVYRRIAFPYADATSATPRLYFGGTLFQRH